MTQPSLPPLVIYHANCLDGFGAAYAAHLHFKSKGLACDFHAARHGDPPPACCRDREVYIVDFSYKRPILKELCEQVTNMVILDHHVSAQRELEGLQHEYANLEIHFDMNRSGAVLSWEYFHPDTPTPQLLLHVQDRDLWRFELKHTEEISVALMSYPHDFDQWGEWAKIGADLRTLIAEGCAINRFRHNMIERYKTRAVLGSIAGYQVPIVNCPGVIASELLGELAERQPFAAGYEDHGDERSWSLRSRGETAVDVAKVAELFGGGGHYHASGFATSLEGQKWCLEADPKEGSEC